MFVKASELEVELLLVLQYIESIYYIIIIIIIPVLLFHH